MLVRALRDRGPGATPLVLVGSRWAISEGAAAAGLPTPDLPVLGEPGDLDGAAGIIDIGVGRPAGFRFGAVAPDCGAHAVLAVERAAELCAAGALSAMVTAPIHKEAVQAAGYRDDIGHQEILARVTQAALTATMLMTPGLRVAHLSTHKPLAAAARYVTRTNVLAKLELVDRSLAQWGLARARIAVAALNPHAGEGGMLGREEIGRTRPGG